MANTLLGTINILQAHNSHTAGDIITVFYDPDTAAFTVYRDPVGAPANAVVTTLGGIYANRSSSGYWQRVNTGFEYQSDSNTITYFLGQTSFPYYRIFTREIIPTGVNDLALSAESITRASSPTANDGAVTLSASGTNSPFQYSIDNITYQSSATFSALFPASYTFYAKDSLNYIRSIDLAVPSDEIPIETVTHGLKYRHEFRETRNGSPRHNTRHKIEIYKRDYSSSVTDVTGGDPSVIISARGEGQPIGTTTIIAHEVAITLLSESFKQFAEIATGDEYEFLILYLIDDSVGKDGTDFNIRFRGYAIPESYVEQYGTSPSYSSFIATDKLGDLKNLPFIESRVVDQFGVSKNQPVNGIIREAYIIDKCLKPLKLDQGYRIAIDMFEAAMDSSSTDTPIHQAYEDCSAYYSEGNPDTSDQVIAKILKPYGAMLLSYENYFYIIKEEQLKQTTINYVEFATIDGSGSAGTLSPRISFKASGSTEFFRYMGSQSLEFTRPVKFVNIIANGLKRDTGIVAAWNENSITYQGDNFIGYQDFNLVLGQPIYSKEYINGKDYGWALDFYADTAFQNSTSYIRTSKNISYSRADKLKIEFEIRVDAYKSVRTGLIAPPAAYMSVKWKAKLGSDYLQADGEWTTTDTINQFFFEDINSGSFKKFSIEVDMPTTAAEVTSSDFDLRIYPATIWEHDLDSTDQADAKADMEAIATVSMALGSRRIVRYISGSEYVYYYYELRSARGTAASTSDLSEIRPTDYASGTRIGRRWYLMKSWSDSSTASFNTYRSKNIIKGVTIKTLPLGQEPPDRFGETNIVSDQNTIDFTVDLHHFDIADQVNNDENIYSNYTRLADGTPTTTWDRLGVGAKTRQAHLKDRLYELYRTPRYRMNVSFYCDMEVSILKHLYDSSDEGRIYALTGVEINPKNGQHTGEIIEIFQDNTPTINDYNDSDFNTSDFA